MSPFWFGRKQYHEEFTSTVYFSIDKMIYYYEHTHKV